VKPEEKIKDRKKFGDVRVYDPDVMLKDRAVASVVVPEATVVAAAPEFEILTVGVPEIVRLVTVNVVKIVPPAVLLQVMFPVPNAMVRTPELLDENRPVVNDLLLRSRVPTESVQVRVDARVRLS